MEEYLDKYNFEKQLKFIKNKLKNKTILIYGTGQLFQYINKNYDLSSLNIIGVTDSKYIQEDKNHTEFGYNIIPYNEFKTFKCDCILIAVKEYINIETFLKRILNNILIIPLVKKNIIDTLAIKLKRITVFQKLLQSKRNTIVLIKANGKKIYNPHIKNLKIQLLGEHNYIEIHDPFIILNKCLIQCNNNCKVIIYKHNIHRKTSIIAQQNSTIIFGEKTTTQQLHTVQNNNSTIKIGKDCQFGSHVVIRTSDSHSIYDVNTRQILNKEQDIIVGNHVWACADVKILKGSQIASNTIIGANAVVNKQFNDENTIIAGLPAKIVKKDVNWERINVDMFRDLKD